MTRRGATWTTENGYLDDIVEATGMDTTFASIFAH